MRGHPPSVEGHPSSDPASPGPLFPQGGKGNCGTLPLALPINTGSTTADRTFARLGPDQWLLIGPEPDTDAIATEIETALAGRFFALVDISHRNVAFEVSGPDATAILNAGCPLDLDRRAFPPGAATCTLLGKAEVVLMRTAEEPVFRVECWRSFATYVHGFLTQAAKDV